jgi:hypothetical protein
MKGIVFTLLNDLVEERFGLGMWDKILAKVQPVSGGVYNAGGTYPDTELFAIVGALSEFTQIPSKVLVQTFGEFMFPVLAKRYQVFFRSGQTLKDFLLSIHSVVHVEVRKLYPNAGLPDFSYEDTGSNSLAMVYRSERRLCALAEGLLLGASKHFGQAIELSHSPCMLHDPTLDYCRFEIIMK